LLHLSGLALSYSQPRTLFPFFTWRHIAALHVVVHSIHGNVIAHDLCSLLQITLTAVAIALAKAHSSNLPQAERLLAINLTGLGTNLIIGWGAWTVVRHRTFRTCVFRAQQALIHASARECCPVRQ